MSCGPKLETGNQETGKAARPVKGLDEFHDTWLKDKGFSERGRADSIIQSLDP